MPSPTLQTLVANAISRREFLTVSGALALGSLAGCVAQAAASSAPHMRFTSVPISTADDVRVPPGYRATPVFLWGDPVSDGPAFRQNAANSAEEQLQQAGQMHDGMHFFPLPAGSRNSTHGLLAINHEFLSLALLYPDGRDNWSLDKVRKGQAAVGVSVIEVRRQNGDWQVVRPSSFARRITALTPMRVGGPAAGAQIMKTRSDPTGRAAQGTLANCANGLTPWGTYLTCEENFHQYFGSGARPQMTVAMHRYGATPRGATSFHEYDTRFDLAADPNEFNKFGWVVEIDPFDPTSVPVKRTALGRCRHESAFYSLGRDGRVAIYTGDDGRFEYIYKFVTAGRFNPNDRQANFNLLDEGTLYVARFLEGGRGEWIELTQGRNGLTADKGFPTQAEVVTYARLAGDAVGATRTDRPEWIVVHPRTGEVYAALTGNNERGKPGREGANALHKANNLYGSVVRWREAGGEASATTFTWDVLVEGGSSTESDPTRRGTVKGDAFTNPDGLAFDYAGNLWITTDTAESTEQDLMTLRGNDALLAVDIRSGETRRLLVGPKGCEVTGLCFTPDNETAFVNIQHPSKGWPNAAIDGRPRSGTLALQKIGGGAIGS